jgi:class 3 adenylate cyclase
MNSDGSVVDLDADPVAAQAERKRRLLRIGVPLLGVVLTLAVILTIAIYAYQANRQGALALSDEILAALDARIAEQVADYFAPAKRAAVIARDLVWNEPSNQREELFEKFAVSALKEIPQITDLMLADGDGNFMMIRRNETTGGLDTKVIRNTATRREVVWIRRDHEGRQAEREEDPTDDYDPRTRPWFTGVLSTTAIYWTNVYRYRTGNETGVTAALRIPDSDAVPVVLGVDITVGDLARFLSRLPIGTSGRAMIIDANGRLVAYPRLEQGSLREGSQESAPRIDAIGDDAAVAAFDRFRVGGPGRRTVEVGGRRYLTSIAPIEAAGHDWSILVVAPEKEFVGFVERNNRTGLVMSLAIVALVAVGAVLLARQGQRADRATRLALDRSRAIRRQSEMLRQLADDPDLFDPSEGRAPLALTESAADISGAKRASLWYLLPDGQTLRCVDSFQRDASVHAAEFEVRRGELPRFFDHLAAGAEIDVSDAAADPRTAELHRLILAPLGSRALSLFPVRRHGHVVGALWLEDPVELTESRQFLRVLASMGALRSSEEIREARNSEHADPGVIVRESERVHSLSADLSRGGSNLSLEDDHYLELSVLAFRLDDPATAASGARSPELVDAVIRAIQEVAADQDIPYLKVVGSEILGAAGFTTGDPSAATRIANTAVAGRERIAELFEANGLAPEFRVGLDCGTAIGREVGADPRLFNLWGEAVDTARTMASSALPGAIQASEAAYLRLRHSFLFRLRGSFYRPLAGTAQSFILAGRL